MAIKRSKTKRTKKARKISAIRCEPHPKLSLEKIKKDFPTACDSVQIALSQVDLESLEGSRRALAELRKMCAMLSDMCEHKELNTIKESQRKTGNSYKACQNLSGKSVHVVNTGQTKVQGSHRS